MLELGLVLVDGVMVSPSPNPTPNPNQVRFHSQKTFCEMEVPAVLSAEDGSSVPFGKVGGLSVETYRVN